MLHRAFLGTLGAIGLILLSNSASAGTLFGSKLNHEPTVPEQCKASRPSDMCSWVLTIGQQNVGHERVPKNGTIIRLRLRSCTAGSFVLQIVDAIPSQHKAKSIRSGPAINYHGNPNNCEGSTIIETFNVNVPVLQGQSLAVIATRVGFIYNASGEGTDVFDSMLSDGVGYRTTTGTGLGDGFLLLQAELNN